MTTVADDLMADQPAGTTYTYRSGPLFPDLFPELNETVTVTRPAPHVPVVPKAGPDGTTLRDAALKQVWENTPMNWRQVAVECLYALARHQQYLTTDDLWDVLPEPPPGVSHSIVGVLWLWAIRHGVVRKTDRMINTTRPVAHARSIPVYESKLWTPGQVGDTDEGAVA